MCEIYFFKLSLKLLGLALRKVIYFRRRGWNLDTKMTQDKLSFSVLPKSNLLKAFIEPSPPTDLGAGRGINGLVHVPPAAVTE